MPDVTPDSLVQYLLTPERSTSQALQALFWPESVALLGASETEGSIGYQCFKNLLSGTFRGTVFPVNPKFTDDITHFDASCPVTYYLESAHYLPESDVSLAIIATPAETVPEILDILGHKKVPAVVVLTLGADAAECHRLGKEHDMVVVGPDSVGIANFTNGFGLHGYLEHLVPFISQTSLPATPQNARAAMLTFSLPPGEDMLQVMDARELCVTQFLSLGVGTLLEPTQAITHWVGDASVDTILVQVENAATHHALAQWVKQLPALGNKTIQLFQV